MAETKIRPRKTVEDFLKLPEGVRAELIEGEIYMSPSPKKRHQQTVLRLARLLSDFVESRGQGEIFIAPFDVHLPGGDVVEPDVIFVSRANGGIVRDWIRGTPDLLIEVVSPDNAERDRAIKRDLYARNGVPEYWIVDPEESSVEVLKRHGAAYEPWGYFEIADTLTSATLTGLTLPVRAIFE
jgi:Uma2 family endonuclease